MRTQAGSIPGLAQWVKDLALLWALGHPTDDIPLRTVPMEHTHGMLRVPQKKKKKKKKKKKFWIETLRLH